MATSLGFTVAEPMSFSYGIIGTGAIGLGLVRLLGARQCRLLVRDTKAASAPYQYSVEGHDDSSTTAVSKSFALNVKQHILSSLSPRDFRQLDVLVIPVKFYQLDALIQQLKGHLPEQLNLLLLQNGFGGHEALASAFPNNPIYIASTTDAIVKTSDSSIQINARGELLIGSIRERSLPNAIKALLERHPKGVWHKDILNYLYVKLAVNAVINPLTAKYRCKNGEIRAYPDIIANLKAEIFRLYRALKLGIDIDELGYYIDSVIALTENNYSSMYQDIKLGRPTEVEGILGVLIKKAAAHKMQLPLVESLYSEISVL
jgi:2-dehydropantoate 2-reductase